MNETIKILFLDDEDAFRDQRIDQLQMLFPGRLEFFPAATPEAALSILKDEEIDVAIVDIFMKDGKPGGIQVAREASGRGVSTIIYSGKEAKGYRAQVQAKSIGPVAYVQKTGDIADLKPHIERLIAQHDAIRASLAHADQVELINHRFGWRLGTSVAVRFHVGDVTFADLKTFRDSTTPREAEQMWRLTFALNAWTRIIRRQQGDVLTLGGRVMVAWFPDDAEASGLQRAVDALQLMANESAAEPDRVWHSIRFSAGLLPGRYANGLFGDRLPGLAAVVSPLVDVAVALADGATPMTAATLSQWMNPAESGIFAKLGTELESINIAMPEISMGILPVDRRQIA